VYRFRKTVKCPGDLTSYSDATKISEDQAKIYDVIYCCEYLGFLDEKEKKVGCLLHPQQNNNVDLRDASFYGKGLCEKHLCLSYHYLSREEKLAFVNLSDDWYLYGLCVTDIDLIKSYFRIVSERVCEMPSSEKFKENTFKDVALRFFSFKISWPFRAYAANRFGKYYFDGSEYMISHIDYKKLGCERSRFDSIFLSLSSNFKNLQELREAENLIQINVDEFADKYLGFQ
jgi:hypothetical protein